MVEKELAEAALREVLEASMTWHRELTPANRARLHAAMVTATEHGLAPYAVAEAASHGNSRFTPLKVRQIVDDWTTRRRTD